VVSDRIGVALTPMETRRDVIVDTALLAESLGYEFFSLNAFPVQRRPSAKTKAPLAHRRRRPKPDRLDSGTPCLARKFGYWLDVLVSATLTGT